MTFNQIKSSLELLKTKSPLRFKSLFQAIELPKGDQSILKKYFLANRIVRKSHAKRSQLGRDPLYTMAPAGIEVLNKISFYENYDKIINYLIENVDINMFTIRQICDSLNIPFDKIYEGHFVKEKLITPKHTHKGETFYVISFDGRLWMSQTGGYRNTVVKEILSAQNKPIPIKKRINIRRDPLPKFWNKDHLKLFISHLAKYKEEATQIKANLALCGVSAFVAHVDIKPSMQWEKEMEIGLQTCDALLALMHIGFNTSKWTNQEIGFAICRGIPVITVKIGATAGGFSSKFQWIKYNPNVQLLTMAIVSTLLENRATSKDMSWSLVHALKHSRSFEQTKLLLNIIPTIEVPSKKLLRMLEEAKENDQVSGRYGAIRKINYIVKNKTKGKIK